MNVPRWFYMTIAGCAFLCTTAYVLRLRESSERFVVAEVISYETVIMYDTKERVLCTVTYPDREERVNVRFRSHFCKAAP